MQVMFISRRAVETVPGARLWAVISIRSPGEPPVVLQPGWAEVLRLEFDDVAHSNIAGLRAFSEEDARQVLQLLRKVRELGWNVLVHCHAGVSRAPAVALFAGAWLGRPVLGHGRPVPPAYAEFNPHVRELLDRCAAGHGPT